MSELHAIVFQSSRWTSVNARKWLKNNNLVFRGKVDKRDAGELRYTINPAKKYKSFGKRYIKGSGLTLIFGFK